MVQLQSSITSEDQQLLLWSSGIVVVTFFANLIHLSYSFMKVY
jgi:hypothetical protein